MRATKRWTQHLTSEIGRHILKVGCLYALLGTTLLLEAWLVWTWLPRLLPDSMSWNEVNVAVALCVMPIVALACLFRLPWGRSRVAPRYVIKPAQCAKVPSSVNPLVITAALNSGIASWRTSAKRGDGAYGPSGASVSVPHLSVPLDWLWGALRRALTGVKDIVVEATFYDDQKPFRLVAWAHGTEFIAKVELDSDQDFFIALERAVEDIVLLLFEGLDPLLRSQIHAASENYDEAIKLLRRQAPSLRRDLELASHLMNCHRDDLAREHLAVISADYVLVRRARKTEIRELGAALDIKVGDYDCARATLTQLLHGRRAQPPEFRQRVLTLLADCERDDGRMEEALRLYGEAQRLALARLPRVTGLTERATREECFRRMQVRSTPEAATLVYQMQVLNSSTATCLRRLGRDPSDQYSGELELVHQYRAMTGYFHWQNLMHAGNVLKYWASADLRFGRLDDATQRFQDALHYFDEAARLQATAQERADDFNSQTQLAWCQCGKLLCTRALLALAQWPDVPVEIEESIRVALALFDAVADESIDALRRHWERACTLPRGSDEADEALLAVSVLATHAMLTCGDDDRIAGMAAALADLRGAETRPVDETIQRSFESVAAISPQGPLDTGERLAFLLGAVAVLQRVREVAPQDVARLQDKVRQKANEQALLALSESMFAALDTSYVHQAEHAYGLACLQAILSNCISYTGLEPIGQVAGYLRRAIDLSSTASSRSGFVGRARNDPDFDHLREHPAIRELLMLA